MNFYEAMQLGACNIKPLIKSAKDDKLRKKYILALIIKNILCLSFCMLIVIFFSTVFGTDNSIVGVVTVIALLTFRFSNLDFKSGQSALTLFAIFIIFAVSPYVASIVNPLVGIMINFISMMIIVILSCHNVALSNQSTLILSYLLLYGYEVNDLKGYFSRIFALILGGILVSGIFYFKHRKINFENNFSDIIKDIDLKNQRTRWQLKLILGISSAILIGEILNLPRVIWIGFSCMSVIQPDNDKFKYRVKKRYPFVIIGSLTFAIIYLILPEGYRGYIGILGGLMVGFSGSYTWQTSFNCFGALMVAVPVFGLWGAVLIRIANNVIGAIYSSAYNKLFDKIFNKIDKAFYNENTISEIG